MLCEVDRSYIEDGFNLYGLRHHFSNFQGCLDIILDRTDEPQDPVVAQSAFMLYGMIHARFIVTARGLEAMVRMFPEHGVLSKYVMVPLCIGLMSICKLDEQSLIMVGLTETISDHDHLYKKYRLAEFGRCPRTMCRQQPVVPATFMTLGHASQDQLDRGLLRFRPKSFDGTWAWYPNTAWLHELGDRSPPDENVVVGVPESVKAAYLDDDDDNDDDDDCGGGGGGGGDQVGIFDEPKKEAVKLYCPRCGDVYNTVSPYGGEPLDGAFFGTSFAHMFFITFDRLVPDPASEIYTPLIFGFKIHKSAKCMQRRLPHGRGSPASTAIALAAAAATNSSASSSAPVHLKSPRPRGGAGTGSKGAAGAMVSAGSGGRSDLSNVGRGSSWGDAGGDAGGDGSGGGRGVLWGGTCAGEGSGGSAVMSGRDGKDGGPGGTSGRNRSGTTGSGSSRRKSRRSSAGPGTSGAADGGGGGGGGGGGRSSSRSSTKGKGKDKRRKRESPGLEDRDDDREDDGGETRRRGRKQQDTSGTGSRLRRDGSQDSAASGLTQASAGGGGNTSANGTGGGIARARSPSLSSAQDIGESRTQQAPERSSASPGPTQVDVVVGGGPVSGPGGVAVGREGNSQAVAPEGDENGKERMDAQVVCRVDSSSQGLGHDEQTHLVHPPGSSGRDQQQATVVTEVGVHGMSSPASAALTPASQVSASGTAVEEAVAAVVAVASSEGMRLSNSNGDDPLSAVVREGGGLATLAAAATISGGGNFTPTSGVTDGVARDSAMRASPDLIDATGDGAQYRREVDVGCDSRGPTSGPRMPSPVVGTRRSPGYMSVSPTSIAVPSSGGAATKGGEGDGHGNSNITGGLGLSLGPSPGDGPPRTSTAMPHDYMATRLAPASETDALELIGKFGGSFENSNIGISTATEVRSRVSGDGGRASLTSEGPILNAPPSTSKDLAREELEARLGGHGSEREAKRMRLD